MSSIEIISIPSRKQRFSASRMESGLGYLDSFTVRIVRGTIDADFVMILQIEMIYFYGRTVRPSGVRLALQIRSKTG